MLAQRPNTKRDTLEPGRRPFDAGLCRPTNAGNCRLNAAASLEMFVFSSLSLYVMLLMRGHYHSLDGMDDLIMNCNEQSETS